MYVCLCRQLREADIAALGARGVTNCAEIVEVLQLADPSLCGRCVKDIEVIADIAVAAAAPPRPRWHGFLRREPAGGAL